jgi:hypothetical protein
MKEDNSIEVKLLGILSRIGGYEPAACGAQILRTQNRMDFSGIGMYFTTSCRKFLSRPGLALSFVQ